VLRFLSPDLIKDCIMRKLLLVTALGLSAALSSAASQADDTGFYARASIGQSDADESGLLVVGDDDTSFAVNFGWRFLPWLAVEAGYNRLGEFDLTCGGEVCPAVVLPPLKIDSVELGLAARVPIGESRWFGQARLGIHHWDVDMIGPGSENDPYFGLGVGYAFNERFNLSLNVDRYEAAALDVDRIGLGFEVAF
jgi:opacity protein-like surface antigen